MRGSPAALTCARARSAHDEVRAAQPLALMRRHVGREFELEGLRNLGRHLAAHGEAASHLKRKKIVDGPDLHEARLLAAGRGQLALEKAAHVLRARRNADDLLQAQLLADLVERVRRPLAERAGHDRPARIASARVMMLRPGRAQWLDAPFDRGLRMASVL